MTPSRDSGNRPSADFGSSTYVLTSSDALKISFPAGWRFDIASLRTPPIAYLRGNSAALMLFPLTPGGMTAEQLLDQQPAAFEQAGGMVTRRNNIDCPPLGRFPVQGFEFLGTFGAGRNYYEICGAITDPTRQAQGPKIHLLKLCVGNVPPPELDCISKELQTIWRSLKLSSSRT